MIEYPKYITLPKTYVRSKIKEFLDEDAPHGDKTTLGTIAPDVVTTAIVQAEEDLIFAGGIIFDVMFENNFELELMVQDGSFVQNEKFIAKIKGSAADILTKERVLLNLLQRLCAIATLTRSYVEIANDSGVKITDTRKTTPGLRLFEKYAVAVGGGWNHRLDLSSGILIKDNHIAAAGSIIQAVENIKALSPDLPIELEVDTIDQIDEALLVGVDGFLLDNMDPINTKKAVSKIRSYPNGNEIFIESSGGITKENLKGYLDTGINAVSIGALTHSVKNSNIHMEFE